MARGGAEGERRQEDGNILSIGISLSFVISKLSVFTKSEDCVKYGKHDFIYLFLKNPKKNPPQERTARIKETGRLTEGSKRLFILKAISWAQKRGSHSQICCSRSLGGDQLVDSC